MCRPKEPRYFDSDLKLPKSARKRELNSYLKLFSRAGSNSQVVGEASTTYLYSIEAVRNILAFNPEARLIACVRNPIDMAMSLHAYAYQEMREDVADFETAWHLQGKRERGKSLPKGAYEPKFMLYGAFCKLGEQLQRVYSLASREQVHVVVFDDFRVATRREYRKLLRFLGLADDGQTTFPVLNATGLPRNRRYHRIVSKLYAARQSLPIPEIGSHLISKIARLNHRPGRSQAIAAPCRRELVEYFKDDVKLLSELLRRDLTSWLAEKDSTVRR